MGFKERTRDYWHEVGEHKCQYEYWDGKNDKWVECGKESKHIHHIIPESRTLAEGGNPEDNVGMPLCEEHHLRNLGEEEHSNVFSFHPDYGHAYRDYSFWKEQVNRFGKKAAGVSPFQEVTVEHKEKAEKGERTHGGTVEIDHYYKEKMRSKALIYNATTDEKKPRTKQHPKTDRSKKKNWYNEFFKTEEAEPQLNLWVEVLQLANDYVTKDIDPTDRLEEIGEEMGGCTHDIEDIRALMRIAKRVRGDFNKDPDS